MFTIAPRSLSVSKWLPPVVTRTTASRLSPCRLFGLVHRAALGRPGSPERFFLAAVALALLSRKMGAALGLAGRCRGSTQLGKAAVAGFQA